MPKPASTTSVAPGALAMKSITTATERPQAASVAVSKAPVQTPKAPVATSSHLENRPHLEPPLYFQAAS